MKNDIGIVRIDLVEVLPADAITEIIETFNELYFCFLWIELAKESTSKEVFSDYYRLEEDEKLYVYRIDIGTPNFIELAGLADPLQNTLQFLHDTGILEGIGILVNVVFGFSGIKIKSSIEKQKQIKKDRKELKKIKKQIKKQNRMLEDIVELLEQNRISKNAYDHKVEIINRYKSNSLKRLYFNVYVTNTSLDVFSDD